MIPRLAIKTRSKVEFLDITSRIREAVSASKAESGVCYLFVPHTTAAITVNEHADPSVTDDITRQLETIAPEHLNYLHSEGNAPAHVKASLVGSSLNLFIDKGELVLGTWQGVFFCEFDGPRSRDLLVKVVPDEP
ncbi:MAG: secondary thiamine-phosphate synthase enzyme YjbQ [Chloroflexota bacterium]